MKIINNNKIAVVTGAGRRLGRDFAQLMSRLGYAILLHYNSSEIQAHETEELLRSEGANVFPYKADLTDIVQLREMWKYVDSIPFDLEVLINSAAIMNQSDINSLSYTNFDETIALNLRAPLFCSQEAAKLMTSGGLIINISDIGASKNWLGYPAYSISKAGLEVLTRILAKALAPTIRVNAIAPGLVMPHENVSDTIWEKLIAKVPMNRTADSSEITSMIEYLLSNKYITGQILTIDGGFSL